MRNVEAAAHTLANIPMESQMDGQQLVLTDNRLFAECKIKRQMK